MSNPIAIFFRSSLATALFAALSVAACGGNYVSADGADSGDGTDFSSDASGGTSPGSGGASSAGGTGGEASGGSAGGPPVCCTAVATCDGTDQQIESEAACPIGATCYSATACCSTIWCMEEQALCDGIPTCLGDEVEVTECSPDAVCTARALCATIILCQKEGVSCERAEEPDRHYVAESPDSCALIDLLCPEHTTGFSNECGCGCEQPAECPDLVDCEPGGTADPLCDSAECPYSDRAF